MKTCTKCLKEFKTWAKVDGKKRYFSHRKYCLDCSPFNLHNTQKIELKNDPFSVKRTCNECKKEFIYNKNKGHSKSKCNTCKSNFRRNRMKQRAVDFLGGKCQKCGYDKYIGALSFHHIDPKQKDFQIGGTYNLSWEKIQKEISKCNLFCMNCHAEEHFKLRALEP